MAFGVAQLQKETPSWAKYVFRITLILTTVAAFWIQGTSLIAESHKLEVVNGLKALDVLVWALSKFFGEEVKQEGVCTDKECFPGPQ